MASYEKQEWINSPTQTTPINATRLNHIEDGIENAYEFDKTGCKVISSATNVEDAIKELDASNDAINSNLSKIGQVYDLDKTNITTIPQAQETTIYSKVLPQGRYILTAKIYMAGASGVFISCNELRQQISGTIIYDTLSGYVYSDGTTPTKINVYQSGASSVDRPYTYDFVRAIRLE